MLIKQILFQNFEVTYLIKEMREPLSAQGIYRLPYSDINMYEDIVNLTQQKQRDTKVPHRLDWVRDHCG